MYAKLKKIKKVVICRIITDVFLVGGGITAAVVVTSGASETGTDVKNVEGLIGTDAAVIEGGLLVYFDSLFSAYVFDFSCFKSSCLAYVLYIILEKPSV